VYDALLMAADYSITAEAWGQQRYDLKQNLTIASAPGHLFKLEFGFVSQALRLPAGVTVTLRDVVIGKDRQAPGWSLPFFAGVLAAAAAAATAFTVKDLEAAVPQQCILAKISVHEVTRAVCNESASSVLAPLGMAAAAAGSGIMLHMLS
jgi:hypothetical protein